MMSLHGNHLLQLYDDAASLVDNVAGYLAEGARLGDGLIIVATAPRVEAFTRRLSELDVDVPVLQKEGRLTILDAEATLARFMVDGRPDGDRFEAVVGRFVRETKARDRTRGLRAYGEMVDVLWSAGRAEAAIELEGFWNQLLREESFTLFCAYAFDLLAPGTSTSAMLPVLARHTQLIPGLTNARLESALNAALRETLGGEAVDALLPLIRATHHARATDPGPEALLLWVRNHLPHMADAVLSRSRALYETCP